MRAAQDCSPPIVGLSDELIRLSGRLRVLFADARREGLGDSEITALNAVVEADGPPTVPQVGSQGDAPGGHISLAFADGPTDVHRSQFARSYLKKVKPAEGLFPSEHIPTRTAAALERYPNARNPK